MCRGACPVRVDRLSMCHDPMPSDRRRATPCTAFQAAFRRVQGQFTYKTFAGSCLEGR